MILFLLLIIIYCISQKDPYLLLGSLMKHNNNRQPLQMEEEYKIYHDIGSTILPSTASILNKIRAKFPKKYCALQRNEVCLNDQRNRYYGTYHVMRLFKVQPTTRLVFFDRIRLSQYYGDIIRCLCLVRSFQHPESYLLFIVFTQPLLKRWVTAQADKLIHSICQSSHIPSGTNVIQTANRFTKKNLFFNTILEYGGFRRENQLIFLIDSQQLEEHAEGDQTAELQVGSMKVVQTLKEMFIEQFFNKCLIPDDYDTIIKQLTKMSEEQLQNFLYSHDLTTLYQEFTNKVYMCVVARFIQLPASQNFKQNQQYVSSITDGGIRSQVLRESHDQVFKIFIQTLFSSDQFKLYHPNIYHSLLRSVGDLLKYEVLDLAIYEPSFILSCLLVSRYIAKVLFPHPSKVSSNKSCLFLCGKAGSGKSMICQILEKYLNGYKWIEGNFQSERIVSCGAIICEEILMEKLRSPVYKQLMDFSSTVKIDLKNKEPVDVSRHCPVILTTNEDCWEYFSNSRQHSMFQLTQFEHKQAIKRRLYIVPFLQKFSYIAPLLTDCNVPHTDKKYADPNYYFPSTFNLLIALAASWSNQQITTLPQTALKSYFQHLHTSFQSTFFGKMFTHAFDYFETIVQEVETFLEGFEDTTRQDSVLQQLVDTHVKKIKQIIDHFILEYAYGQSDYLTQLAISYSHIPRTDYYSLLIYKLHLFGTLRYHKPFHQYHVDFQNYYTTFSYPWYYFVQEMSSTSEGYHSEDDDVMSREFNIDTYARRHSLAESDTSLNDIFGQPPRVRTSILSRQNSDLVEHVLLDHLIERRGSFDLEQSAMNL